jgi:NAD(P)-dependent dehydrogenase (short-subunit alcohol dehydrogenase family)
LKLKNYRNLFDLGGRIAVVTGAAMGLGREIAHIFSQYNAAVALVDIDEKNLENVKREIEDEGGTAIAVTCNVAKSDEVRKTVESVLSAFGKIDIMVNNAGIGRRKPCEEMSDEDFNDVIDINLKSFFYFCRETGKHMIARGEGGKIINMSSITGVVGVETGNANYSASKGGIIAMTRCLAIEWAKHGILVNALAPTHMRTHIIEKLITDDPEKEKYFLNNIPLGRLGTVEDIAGAALFLASDASDFITGHVLLVDGGHTAK